MMEKEDGEISSKILITGLVLSYNCILDSVINHCVDNYSVCVNNDVNTYRIVNH
jgi:hypothetical protein